MLEMTMTRSQMNLKYLNYYHGEIDGIKGSQTASAIYNFKNHYQIQPVNEYLDQIAIDFMRSLICNIQAILNVERDGVAGEQTAEKTRQYQQEHNLLIDGIAGEQTLNCMFNQPTPSEWNFAHFKKEEFNCKCCGANFINYRLVEILEQIRNRFNNPVIITSGCRCVKHNAEVGGVAGSYHTKGTASDFYIENVNKMDVLYYCKQLVNNGTLRYTYTNDSNMSNAIHIDIG